MKKIAILLLILLFPSCFANAYDSKWVYLTVEDDVETYYNPSSINYKINDYYWRAYVQTLSKNLYREGYLISTVLVDFNNETIELISANPYHDNGVRIFNLTVNPRLVGMRNSPVSIYNSNSLQCLFYAVSPQNILKPEITPD